jgi:sigma-E factor negative regulatory protein RseB
MRPGLLLTAVATVTVPGLLAMLAVAGHEHVAAGANVKVVALDGAPLSQPLPLTPASERAAVRADVAGGQRVPGAPAPVLSGMTAGQRAIGISLLDQAASAGLTTSYKGTEAVSQSGVAGTVGTVTQVWHQGGGRTLVETLDGTTSAATHPATGQSAGVAVASDDPASSPPEGVFGVTKGLVAQLDEHYFALYWGTGSVAGRPASVVELYRPNNTLAARYWLDNQTMVPLRRELYDTSGNVVISEDFFVQVQFGAVTVPQSAATGPATAQQAQPSQSWVAAASPAKFLRSLTGQGWQVPASPPGGLPLSAAASTKTASGEIVDLEYTDGLYDISLFVQRGTLAPDMSGWRQVTVAGQQAFVSGSSVTWSRLGFVYTMIADAPPQTVRQIVRAVPGGPPGVLDRLGRGLVRLARVMNPFR